MVTSTWADYPSICKAWRPSARASARSAQAWSFGDLLDELGDQQLAEGLEALGFDHERTGAADDVVLVVGGETARGMGVHRIGRQGPLAQDDETVDRHAFGNGRITRRRHRPAAVVGAIA